MRTLVIDTPDDVYYVDSESLHMVARWGKKWLAAAADNDARTYLISLDHVICIEEPEEGDE